MSHRPWEEGADFAIGLAAIDEAHWLEGGEADPAARKDPLYDAHRELVWGETPASRSGQAEAAALLGARASCDLPPLYAAARAVHLHEFHHGLHQRRGLLVKKYLMSQAHVDGYP